MGLMYNSVRFLLEAGRGSECFTDTVTLGRQWLLHTDAPSLASLLSEYGYPTSEQQAEAIIRDGNGFCEPLFRALGARRVDSIDYSSFEAATITHDMNQPIPDHLKSTYTAVVDGGCLEHVFNFPVAIRNCMEMLAVGGKFLSITVGNNWMGHGFYQFSPELFFRIFEPANGFEMERLIVVDIMGGGHWYEVSDPSRVRRRVCAQTHGPIDLLIQARKIAEVPVFATVPQQSDYATAWEKSSGNVDSSRSSPSGNRAGASQPWNLARVKGIARQYTPSFALDLYRRARDRRASKQFDSEVFRMIR